MNINAPHYSVLLDESIDLLDINPSGTYIDGTFGRGGHSCAILSKIGENGTLLAFDKDPEAISYGKQNVVDDRLSLIHDSFANADKYLKQFNINNGVNGILLDLGVSSPQVDDASRGFSFRFDSDLDMRMDNSSGMTAMEWLNHVEEAELSHVLWKYGEEKFARRIAKNIVQERKNKLICTTFDLVKVIEQSIPFKEAKQHKATRSFQAIRIFINNELGDLETILNKLPTILTTGGRCVIISFHSLEDRIVKNSFNDLVSGQKQPKWVMLEEQVPKYQIIAKKVRAGKLELANNKRSHSAILRCLKRI